MNVKEDSLGLTVRVKLKSIEKEKPATCDAHERYAASDFIHPSTITSPHQVILHSILPNLALNCYLSRTIASLRFKMALYTVLCF